MTSPKPPQGGPFFWQGDPGAPTGYRAVTQFSWSQHTQFADTYRYLKNLQNCGLWHKCLHVDLLDGKHGMALISAINADDFDAEEYNDADVDHPNFNDVTPAAPNGGLNVKWQSDSSSYVSAYVPFSSLSAATIVSTDYVVITDTSDSNNPKRGLVSDIAAMVSAAPTDAQYVTLATNATLTNERVLTAGTGLDLVDAGAGSTVTIDLDLNEVTTAAAAALDHLIFVDADDAGTKKTTMPDALVALGAQPIDATLTALAAHNTNGLLTQTAADTFTGRTIVVSGDALAIANGDGVSGNPALSVAADLENIVDVWAVDASGNASGIGTIGSGAITSTGSIKSTSSSAGIGYATGAGATVTQATDKATSVTINAVCGQIETHDANLPAGGTAVFAVNNSAVAATDVVVAVIAAGASSTGKYRVQATEIDSGTFNIGLDNISAGDLAEAVTISFVVIKGVTS